VCKSGTLCDHLMKTKKIKNPDTANEKPSYWEKVLSSHKLSMEKGRAPRFRRNGKQIRKVKFVGGMRNIEGIQEQQFRKRTGRVEPKGHGPDD
jgi:hypothetical protein